MTVLEVFGLYIGVPALLFGAISALVLLSQRSARPTGFPVLRPDAILSDGERTRSEAVPDGQTGGGEPPDQDEGPPS